MKLCVLLILLGVSEWCRAGRILLLLPVPSKSHYILSEYMVEKLVEKGHEITIVAPYKKSTPLQNVTEIFIPDATELVFKKMMVEKPAEGRFQMRNMNPLLFFALGNLGKVMMEIAMDIEEVQKLITSEQNFDLIMGDGFLLEGLLAGLSRRFKAPLVIISPSMPIAYLNEMIGNTAPPAYVPDALLGLTDKMTFWERVVNFLYTIFTKFMLYWVHIPQQDRLLKEYFGEDSPPLTEILSNNSLILINHHFSLAFPRPYIPGMVEVGGFHVKPPKPLPKDLQKFMDEAKEGVIYFSMGSNLKSAEFPKEKFDGILRAFSRLKQKVLWKFENENPPNLPKNVKISKWLPQSDLLAHPNMKLFISHGGLLSLTESISRGVPVVGIPIFGDQPANMKVFEQIEVAVKLEFDDIAEESLYNCIREVLDNPKYTENAKLRSKILQDRPLSPVDTAVFWVEYAMRHKGAPHLRSAAKDLQWYQQNSLDVIIVLGFIVFLFVYILKRLFRVTRTLLQAKTKALPREKKRN